MSEIKAVSINSKIKLLANYNLFEANKTHVLVKLVS